MTTINRSKMERQNSNSKIDTQDILQAIKEEGYFPLTEDNGDVRFKVNGTLLVVTRGASECVSIRVYYAMDENNSEPAVLAANEIMSRYLLVRPVVSPSGDSIVFCIDSFCPSADVFRKMLPESISLLGEAIESHHDEMEKIMKQRSCAVPSMEELIRSMAFSSEKS